MSDSGEQGATISGQVSDSNEQKPPISPQLPDSSEQEAPDSAQAAPNSEENADSGKTPIPEENPDSGEASIPEVNPGSGEAAQDSEENPNPRDEAQDSEENLDFSEGQESEENPDSGESVPIPENTPDSSVGETSGKQVFVFEDVKAALSETVRVFGEENAQVKPLKINFNSHASGSGEANESKAPRPVKPSKLMPNPPSLIKDSDKKGYHGQQEAANPNEQETAPGDSGKQETDSGGSGEQETASSDSGEPEVQSAPPPTVITLNPADWIKAVSEKAKAEEEEENQKEVVPELIHNIKVQQAELKERAVAHPSLLGGSSQNPDPPAADSQPNENTAENVELGKRKIDERGKGKVEENQEDGGEEVSEEAKAASPKSKKLKKPEDEGLVIRDPALLACSNKNPAVPPATAVTKSDSQPSESAAEKKRKIGEKGKGNKGEEKKEDGGEEESEEDETASPKSKEFKNA